MANIPQWIPFAILLAVIVVPHLLSVVLRRDLWPYSHYPMYSDKKSLDDTGFFHVVLEKADGARTRWVPTQIRFSREVNRAFTKLARAKKKGAPESSLDASDLLDLIEQRVRDDHPKIDDFDAFASIAIVFVSCPGIRSRDLQLTEEVRFRRSLSREGAPAARHAESA
jgi:hypothetical protein